MQLSKSLSVVNVMVMAMLVCMATVVKCSPVQTEYSEPVDLLIKRALYGILNQNSPWDNPNYLAFLRREQPKRGSKVTNRAGNNRSLCLWMDTA
ncbi:hypothetical protein Ahia01_001092400 [Argonauta hians]